MSTTHASGRSETPLLDPERASLHHDRVYRAALRLTRSPHDAEDLTQETYVNVLSRPRAVREGDEVGYLLASVRNTHVSAVRRARRRPAVAVAPEDLEAVPRQRSDGDPQAAAEFQEVVAAIGRLPTGQRDVVAAVALVGMSYAGAAAALDVPVGTVMSRLHRARAALAA